MHIIRGSLTRASSAPQTSIGMCWPKCLQVWWHFLRITAVLNTITDKQDTKKQESCPKISFALNTDHITLEWWGLNGQKGQTFTPWASWSGKNNSLHSISHGRFRAWKPEHPGNFGAWTPQKKLNNVYCAAYFCFVFYLLYEMETLHPVMLILSCLLGKSANTVKSHDTFTPHLCVFLDSCVFTKQCLEENLNYWKL